MALRRTLAALVATALWAGAVARPAAAADLPARNQALLLLRVLAYDRNLKKRSGNTVAVLVASRQADRVSEERAEALASAFEEVAQEVVVAGLPVKVEVLHLRDAAGLEARLEAAPAALVYVDEALGGLIHELSRSSRRHGALTAGGSRQAVEAGLSVAVVARQSRALVVVDPQTARQEGADLDSALLAVAEVVAR